jgi:predicted nucleic acid-binding protein
VSGQYGTVVLDCQGLSAWIAQDGKVAPLFKAFRQTGARLVISANTIMEVTHSRMNVPRLNWTLSQIKVEPVTEQSAKAAAKLLMRTGLHGHKYAIDATVAEAALRQPSPVAMLTSDIDGMSRLCGPRVRLIGL